MTPLAEIMDILEIMKENGTVFSNDNIPYKYTKLGVIQASIALSTNWNVVLELDIDNNIIGGYVDTDLTSKEIYMAGLYAFRTYALNQHQEATRKAVNFKTINFAVSGLTEKAKEAMKIVWWCDREIKATKQGITPPMGKLNKMEGEI